MSERPGAGPTTGTGKEKQRTLRKSILPGLLPFPCMLLAHFAAFLLKCRCVQGNHFRFQKKKKNSKIIAVFFTFYCGRRTKTFQYGFSIKLGI